MEKDTRKSFFVHFLSCLHKLSCYLFFNDNILNSDYQPKCIFAKFSRFTRKSLYPRKFLILLIRKSKCPGGMKKMKFLLAFWISKRSNTLSLIHLEEYETPLVFQKLQNVGHDLSFCVLNSTRMS